MEHEFKIGDWVYWKGHNAAFGFIVSKSRYSDDDYVLNVKGSVKTHNSCHYSNLRLAQPHEIPIEFRTKQQYYFY